MIEAGRAWELFRELFELELSSGPRDKAARHRKSMKEKGEGQ
jgi:hypothetical protein